MSVQPQYAAMPTISLVQASTANTNRDGTGTIATLLTGRAPGTRVERVMAKAAVTTTAGMLRIYLKLASGDTWRLLAEIAVTAVTPSASVAAWSGEWAPTNGLSLGDGHMLGVSTHNAEAFNVVALGGNL